MDSGVAPDAGAVVDSGADVADTVIVDVRPE